MKNDEIDAIAERFKNFPYGKLPRIVVHNHEVVVAVKELCAALRKQKAISRKLAEKLTQTKLGKCEVNGECYPQDFDECADCWLKDAEQEVENERSKAKA
jgi:hypothetical protein